MRPGSAALALAAFLAVSCAPPAVQTAPLPRWQAASLSDGATVQVAAEEGLVVVNVWATWCEPCRREMPSLEAAHRALAPKGVRVIGLNIDRDVLLAREHARKMGLTFTNLSDPAQAIARDALAVSRLPTTLAIGRDGRVRWREESARDWAEPSRLARIERTAAEGAP